jgi:hypothetical protein
MHHDGASNLPGSVPRCRAPGFDFESRLHSAVEGLSHGGLDRNTECRHPADSEYVERVMAKNPGKSPKASLRMPQLW